MSPTSAAQHDLRFAIALLRKGRAVAVDLQHLLGGSRFLIHPDGALAAEYAAEIDRGVALMPGFYTRGSTLRTT